MTPVTNIHARRLKKPKTLPELSVFELAVARAMTRPVVQDCEQIRVMLSVWFLQDVRMRDIEDALCSMAERGFVRTGAEGAETCALTEYRITAVTTLYGGCIRMIDRVPAIFSLLQTPGDSGHA